MPVNIILDRHTHWCNMFPMCEDNKIEELGKAAEEYSNIRGKLNQVHAKLTKALSDYQLATQVFQTLEAENGKLVFQHSAHLGSQPRTLDELLNASQLAELIAERSRLSSELDATTKKVRILAPHLI
jgi:hypothetical protein